MINNRLNNVMKYLTSITLVMGIPTIISGFYGMNVDSDWVPLARTAHGFLIIALITISICGLLFAFLRKKRIL